MNAQFNSNAAIDNSNIKRVHAIVLQSALNDKVTFESRPNGYVFANAGGVMLSINDGVTIVNAGKLDKLPRNISNALFSCASRWTQRELRARIGELTKGAQ